jgi:preprotein translocase subunit SecF
VSDLSRPGADQPAAHSVRRSVQSVSTCCWNLGVIVLPPLLLVVLFTETWDTFTLAATVGTSASLCATQAPNPWHVSFSSLENCMGAADLSASA